MWGAEGKGCPRVGRRVNSSWEEMEGEQGLHISEAAEGRRGQEEKVRTGEGGGWRALVRTEAKRVEGKRKDGDQRGGESH